MGVPRHAAPGGATLTGPGRRSSRSQGGPPGVEEAEASGDGVAASDRDGWGRVHVEVAANRTRPGERLTETTTVLRFTFDVEVPRGRSVKRVLPTTREEVERILRYHPGSRLDP